eukprot:COSAG01_NODE_1406_length_10435_cov_24.133017_13_plen_117_part_00
MSCGELRHAWLLHAGCALTLRMGHTRQGPGATGVIVIFIREYARTAVRVRLYSVAEFVEQYVRLYSMQRGRIRLRIQIQLYCTFAFSVQQEFSLLSWQGFGQQQQIRSAASNLVEF